MLLDEEDAGAPFVGGGAHRLQETSHDHRCETERELVREQQGRLPAERPRECQHLLLPTGEEAAAHPEALLQLREQPQRSLRLDVAYAEVVERGQLLEDRALLHHESRAPSRPAVERRFGHDSVEPYLAAEQRQLAGEREQGRGLSRAVGAEEGDDLALVDDDVDVVDDGLGAVSDGKAA